MTETNTGKREKWVDYVKIIACILVVLGHFFQSMVKANIIEASVLYNWFNTTIYYFHVPLFFICSGYLYQRYTKIMQLKDWKNNILKKLLALGIPYFIFSIATWLLKTVFAGNVNSEAAGLAETLFTNPSAPYWYLYSLFFIFVITITYKNKTNKILLLVFAIVLKGIALLTGGVGIYAISTVMANEIWFVIGMSLTDVDMDKIKNRFVGIILGIIFIVLSVVVYRQNITNSLVTFLLGLLACASILWIMISCRRYDNRLMDFMAKYTMPIFLMHTLFAAPVRTILLKMGIANAIAQIVVGLLAGFIGPVFVAMILEKTKYLELVLYPNKVIKMVQREKKSEGFDGK